MPKAQRVKYTPMPRLQWWDGGECPKVVFSESALRLAGSTGKRHFTSNLKIVPKCGMWELDAAVVYHI